MIRTRRWPPSLPMILGLLGLLGLPACGPLKPELPRSQVRGPLPAGDAVAGGRLHSNRGLGRTGFACADCHPVDAPRPARALTGATPAEIDWCVERFLRRPALSAQQIADLQAAPPPRRAAPAETGRGLYRQQCAHCHERGPGPAVLGEPWPRDHLRAVIRGTNRPAHPDTLMPAFLVSELDDDALERLIAYIVGSSAAKPAFLPLHVGLSPLWMMVGSR